MSDVDFIPDAKTMWQNQSDKDSFHKACESVLRDIEKAQNKGMRKTNFYPRPHEQYEAVKMAFKNKGYYFTPTGYIGGVWQLTEDINW